MTREEQIKKATEIFGKPQRLWKFLGYKNYLGSYHEYKKNINGIPCRKITFILNVCYMFQNFISRVKI